jgi:hypothetical protein
MENIEGVNFEITTYSESEVITYLNEGKNKGRELVGNYTIDHHQPHNSTGDYHIHLSEKGNEILAINKNGSAHDGYHGIRIPNKPFKALIKKYPDWNLPENQLIESYSDVLFVNPSQLNGLKLVRVLKHQMVNYVATDGYKGFFHRFADEPLFNQSSGFTARTVALVEDIDGYIQIVPVTKIKFLQI